MSKTNTLDVIGNGDGPEAHPPLRQFMAKDTDRVAGRIGFMQLNSGIDLHFSDIVEKVDAVTDSVAAPKLTISLLLEGEVNFFMNDQPFALGGGCNGGEAGRPGCEPGNAAGRIWSTVKPVKFSRRLKRGSRVRKIILSIKPDWLQTMGLGGGLPVGGAGLEANLTRFARSHLASCAWRPTEHAIRLAEDIIDPPSEAQCIQGMVRESRALELLALALQSFAPACRDDEISRPAVPADNCRLIKVHSFIENNLARELSLDEIAREVGFSVSSLQRHFKSTYNTTVVDYIRMRKLELAKSAIENDGLSVSEAGFLAGYSTPSSFATAFKRSYGYPPGSLRKQG